MVLESKVEGGSHIVSASVRRTIQSIKEIVGNFSDSDIYLALKESGMDPNETAQKLLNQDPFHEVKRKRDKRKENICYKSSVAPTMNESHEQSRQGQTMKLTSYSDHNDQRGGFKRNVLPGISLGFRVIRDNRVDNNANKETVPVPVNSTSAANLVISNIRVKSLTGSSNFNEPTSGQQSLQHHNSHPGPRQGRDVSGGIGRQDQSDGRRPSRLQTMKPSESKNSLLGVYSSSSDPIHVPSADSRHGGNIGAIRREVGVVGVRRRSSHSSKYQNCQRGFISNSDPEQDCPSSRVPLQSVSAISRSEQSQNMILEHVRRVGRSSSNRSYQFGDYQKAPQPNKEWKPKSRQSVTVKDPGPIGMPSNSVSVAADSSVLKKDAAQLKDKMAMLNISDNSNVIIAAHLRVSETDRCRLTFGSLGRDFQSLKNSVSQAVGVEEHNVLPSSSPRVFFQEPLTAEPMSNKQLNEMDDHAGHSDFDSPASGAVFEHQSTDKNDTSSPQNVESYADIRLVQHDGPSYNISEAQTQRDASNFPTFLAYEDQTGYDMLYFRPTVNQNLSGQVLPSPQEAPSSHAANSIPTSTLTMVHPVQQQHLAQMHSHLHANHFAAVTPYRQFLSPVYAPPMAMPGYSSNPVYPHPANGSSYLLMPGGSSHLNISGHKYGIQQFKPVQTGSATGFANFASPTGYDINAPGISSVIELDDSSLLKYKDSSLFASNPQADASEVWMSPRDLASLQLSPYYNMTGRTQHAAYIPSHGGHASFSGSAPVAQSSHAHFPGMYHSHPAAVAMASPHHLGNVGVGVAAAAAPGGQFGAYHQPQIGHLNWPGNL